MRPDATALRIDAAYLNALRLGPQRIMQPVRGAKGVPLPVACRLAATGKARVYGDIVEVQP